LYRTIGSAVCVDSDFSNYTYIIIYYMTLMSAVGKACYYLYNLCVHSKDAVKWIIYGVTQLRDVHAHTPDRLFCLDN